MIELTLKSLRSPILPRNEIPPCLHFQTWPSPAAGEKGLLCRRGGTLPRPGTAGAGRRNPGGQQPREQGAHSPPLEQPAPKPSGDVEAKNSLSRFVCLPRNHGGHEAVCSPRDELPNDWRPCSNLSSRLVLMNNLMCSAGRRERIGLLFLARGRWGKILFLATIAVWSSTSSPASNKTPHSIALSGDTAAKSGGHGRRRLGEWQMSLWTSWIYDPQFDPKVVCGQ